MGYLNNDTITVEAILTKKGRELLARGEGFEITQFAVADDEVDYSLWTPTHPLGSAYYGAIIEGMPLVEAVPDETQVMRYKLVTLRRETTTQIPFLTNLPDVVVGITLTAGTTPFTVAPATTNGMNGPGFGYTAILYDSTAAVLTGTGLPSNYSATAPAYLGDVSTATATVASGLTFQIQPKNVASQVVTKITIVGNETGGTYTFPLTVNPAVV